jgi:hypothetical protein
MSGRGQALRAFNPASAAILLTITVAGCSSNPLSSSPSASGDGSFRQRMTNLFSGSPSSDTQALAAADPQQDCPVADIRSGASTLPFNTGKETSANTLRYQATIARLARECAVRGPSMTIKVGVQGRVVVGPVGGPGQVDLPLRYALVQEGPEPKTILTKLHKFPVTIGDGQTNVPFVDIEEDLTFTITSRAALEYYVVYVGFDAAASREAPAPKKTRRAR